MNPWKGLRLNDKSQGKDISTCPHQIFIEGLQKSEYTYKETHEKTRKEMHEMHYFDKSPWRHEPISKHPRDKTLHVLYYHIKHDKSTSNLL